MVKEKVTETGQLNRSGINRTLKVLLFLLFVPFLNYGQTSTQTLDGYYNAAANYGFSCNVRVEITKSISGNKIVFRSKLLSVTIADNNGWYDNSTHKYISCDIIGNYCVIYPQFLHVKTEYGNLPFNASTFTYVGESQTIYETDVETFKLVVGAEASTFKVPAISQTIITHKSDAPIWSKLQSIRQTGNSTNNAASGNTNPLSNNTANPGTNSSTTNQTTNNYDPNTGLYSNPLGNSAPATTDRFTQNAQNATTVVNGLAQLLTPSQEEIERRERQLAKETQKEQTAQELGQMAFYEFKEFTDYYMAQANQGDTSLQNMLISKRSEIFYKYLNKSKKEYDIEGNSYIWPNLESLLSQDLIMKWKTANELKKAESGDAGAFKKLAELSETKARQYAWGTAEFMLHRQNAYEYMKKAADIGDAEAMYYLYDNSSYMPNRSQYLNDGKLSEQFFSIEMHYLLMAVDNGCPEAMTRLGSLYSSEKGATIRGLKLDYNLAIEWTLKAFEANDKYTAKDGCKIKYFSYYYKELAEWYRKIGDKENAAKYKELYKQSK